VETVDNADTLVPYKSVVSLNVAKETAGTARVYISWRMQEQPPFSFSSNLHPLMRQLKVIAIIPWGGKGSRKRDIPLCTVVLTSQLK
jgi:hypothetical protein